MLTYWWRFGDLLLPERFILGIALLSLLVVVLNSAFGAYHRWRVKNISILVSRLVLVWLITAMLATSIIYFTHSANIKKLNEEIPWIGKLAQGQLDVYAADVKVKESQVKVNEQNVKTDIE